MSYQSYPGPQDGNAVQSTIARKYLRERLETMTPVQLLVTVYDIAIESCHRKDRQRASRAIVELISALNFEHEEMASGFYRIYEFCMSQVKSGHFDQARELLQELRTAWTDASNQNPAVANSPASLARMPALQA